MKKIMFLIIGILLSISLNAQWYQSYGVTNMNDLSKDQCDLALQKANKSIKTGKIMTVIGAGACVIGAVIYSSGLNEIVDSSTLSGIDEGLNKGIAGAYIGGAGALIACIGVPVWISGENQKSQIEIALAGFNTSQIKVVPGIKFSYNF